MPDLNMLMHKRPRVWIYEDLYGAFEHGRLKMAQHKMGNTRGEMYMPVAKAEEQVAKAVKQRDEELAQRADGLPPAIEDWVSTMPSPAQPPIRNMLLAAFNIQVEDVVRQRDEELRERALSGVVACLEACGRWTMTPTGINGPPLSEQAIREGVDVVSAADLLEAVRNLAALEGSDV